MILKEFSRMLAEELGARRLVPGDTARPVRGLAVEEPTEGWLEKDEVAVTSREELVFEFLRSVREAGAPAILWRKDGEVPPEAAERATELGLGLFMVSPEVPLRRLLSIFSGGDGLLLLSHGAGRALLEIRRPTGSSTTTGRSSNSEIRAVSSSMELSPPALSRSFRIAS